MTPSRESLDPYLVGWQEVIAGNARITIEWEGEGHDGEFVEDDPTDVPLLRFTGYRRETPDAEWEDVEDASYCCGLPATLPAVVVQRALARCMAEIQGPLERGHAGRVAKNLIGMEPDHDMLQALDEDPARFPHHLRGLLATAPHYARLAIEAVSTATLATLGQDDWARLLHTGDAALRASALQRLGDTGLPAPPPAPPAPRRPPAASPPNRRR